jgi:hypothetical protein
LLLAEDVREEIEIGRLLFVRARPGEAAERRRRFRLAVQQSFKGIGAVPGGDEVGGHPRW